MNKNQTGYNLPPRGRLKTPLTLSLSAVTVSGANSELLECLLTGSTLADLLLGCVQKQMIPTTKNNNYKEFIFTSRGVEDGGSASSVAASSG